MRAIEQLTRLQNQANPLSRIAIERPVKGQPPQLVVQVPANVSLQAPVKITHEKDVILDAPVQRCGTGGCMTQIALQDASLKTLRTLTGRGAITFKDANDRDVAIPIAFDGFAAAYDALLKK